MQTETSQPPIEPATGHNPTLKPSTVTVEDEEQAVAVDVNLIEAERILQDYISLMQKHGNLTSTRSAL